MATHDDPDVPPTRIPEPSTPGDDRRPEDDDVPDTPPTEPEPVPIEEPPAAPGKRGPYIVDGALPAGATHRARDREWSA